MTGPMNESAYVEALKNDGFSFMGKPPVEVRYLRVGGRLIQLRFASEKIIEAVLPAVEHLICEPEAGLSLIVTLCDRPRAGEVHDLSPWREEIERCRDKLLMVNAEAFHMQYNPDSTVYSLIDLASKRAIYYADDFGKVPYYERSAPLKFILHWWCEHQGWCLVHAGAVGLAEAGVLLVGRGGSGKSTTAVCAALNGLLYAGDDYVVLRHSPGPSALSLYVSGKLNEDMLSGLPGLLPHVANGERSPGDKALVFFGEAFQSVWTGEIPLRAIVATKISDGIARLQKSSATLVFAEMAASTIFQMPGSGGQTLAAVKKLFSELPVYTLWLDSDFSENIRLINTFCKEIKGG
ncbi:MAG TPA: hypothetical protein PK090_12820 [Smithellaceae bacterium]|nr:hypothetical protein [Smithellaceae bacterium]